MMNNKSQGPDPAVEQAIQRLSRTELTPLEEVIFQSWAQANQLDDVDNPENQTDFRAIYKETGGKVMPPGQLKNESDKESAIMTLMEAQKAHDAQSPMKMMMERRQAQSSPILGDASAGPQGSDMPMSAAPQAGVDNGEGF